MKKLMNIRLVLAVLLLPLTLRAQEIRDMDIRVDADRNPAPEIPVVKAKFCPNCGTPYRNDTVKFCANCGTPRK